MEGSLPKRGESPSRPQHRQLQPFSGVPPP